MGERARSLRKSESDKKHRIYDTLQSIREAMVKRKYNQAWEQAAKYYEQNKNSLKNEEIFQLSWLSCESINKKVNIRLTAQPKSYAPALTKTHLQHLFSLYCSLHTQLLPEVINHDKAYFGMLSNAEETTNPKAHFPDDLIFQRRENSFFLKEEKVDKELRKLMREHLRITNNTLMFKVKRRKEGESLLEAVKICEDIFRSVKEHEFPVEIINFQLIKLTIIQGLGVKEGIVCNYHLPVGLIAKIYGHLRGNKDDALQHYIKKLISYFVLSFRNCSISIEDVYIACQQMLYLSKLIKQKSSPNLYHAQDLKKKFNLLKLNRQITIEKDHIDENYISRANKSNISSFSTSNKLSEKKLESKTRIFKPDEHLKAIANAALDKINAYLAGRREVIKIALSYFQEVYLKNIRSHPSDEYIEAEVLLKLSRKNRKSGHNAEGNSEQALEKVLRKEGKSLSSLLKKKVLQKKLSIGDDDQEAAFNTQTANKKQGKFIIRNIQALKLDSKPKNDEVYCKEVEKIIGFANELNEAQLIEQSSSDEQGSCKYEFQSARRRQIREMRTCREGIEVISLAMMTGRLQGSDCTTDQQNMQSSKFNEDRLNSICLLDEVIGKTVSKVLDVPSNSKEQQKQKQRHSHSYHSVGKLDGLKMEIENLNLERRLLVEDLMRKGERNEIDSLDITANYFNSSLMEDKDEIARLGAETKAKIERYAVSFAKMANIEKQNRKGVVGLAQPKIKLQIDKKGKANPPQLTYARLQEQYRWVEGIKEDRKQPWDMFLSCQYDKLRRDVAKNQFASQNQKKGNKKGKCETIRQQSYEQQLY